MDSLPGSSISTFGGSPLAATAGLANLKFLLENELQANALRIGQRMITRLQNELADSPIVAEVRGKGLMLGVEIINPPDGAPSPSGAKAVLENAKLMGLLVGRGGVDGNVLRIAPPLSITESEVDAGVGILVGAITRAAGNL